MAHPHAGIRQNKVEKSRVSKITKGYASGGAVHSDETEDKALIKKMVRKPALKAEGNTAKHRPDRPGRKSGGRVKNAKTVVNVITSPQPPAPPIPAIAGLGGPPPGPPPMAKPPMPMPPPGGAPGAGLPPGMPPGMPPGLPMRKKGGRVNDGTKVFNKSMEKAGERPITHDKGKNDLKDMNRKRVVTFATGGGIKTFMAGGRVEAPQGVAPATKLPGGAGGGEGRLAKARRAARK